jgi:Cof subfamily protein (haloacid dehalogenase superfamily)
MTLNAGCTVGRQFRLRGVALDLDGTVLRSDYSISPGLAQLGKELGERRVWLTLASARPPRSVQTIAELLNSNGPWIALNGAIVFSKESEIIWRRSLPRDTVTAIRDLCIREPNLSYNIYSGFEWLVGRYDDRIAAEAKIVGFEPVRFGASSSIWPTADKILLIVPEGQERRICDHVMSITPAARASVSKPTYVEITHREANKATALTVAAGVAKVDTSCVLAAGDGENDIPMLSLCGSSIAMAHSPQAVKQAARWVVGTNDDDSLTRKIRSLLRGEKSNG